MVVLMSSEQGIRPYDLAGNWCKECGRLKMNRLLDVLTGCLACDEVITRHRCTGRPDLDALAVGDSWECTDCGSVWSAGEEEKPCPDCCTECGHRIVVKRWFVIEGERLDTAPRYKPEPFAPFRNVFISRRVTRPLSLGACYRTRSGQQVHVKPECRCKR